MKAILLFVLVSIFFFLISLCYVPDEPKVTLRRLLDDLKDGKVSDIVGISPISVNYQTISSHDLQSILEELDLFKLNLVSKVDKYQVIWVVRFMHNHNPKVIHFFKKYGAIHIGFQDQIFTVQGNVYSKISRFIPNLEK